MNELLEIIREINQEKTAKGISPSAALYSEIVSRVSMPRDTIHNTLNELVRSGKIKWHRTLNQTSFEIIEQ